MTYSMSTLALAGVLFLGMLVLLEAGRRIGLRRAKRDPEKSTAGLAALDGAVFGLMGLLVAFTFSGAASRLDGRRQLIVDEVNDIGTAYLRLDLLPKDAQPPLRDLFRRYVDARIAVYAKLPDVEAAEKELVESVRLQQEIWSQAVSACAASDSSPCTMLLLPALNAMIDITTTRTMAMQAHPPSSIFAMLFGLSLASALLAGYGMAGSSRRSWLHMCCFALVIALAVYVILNLEYPRLGVIRIEAFDQALVELRESMN